MKHQRNHLPTCIATPFKGVPIQNFSGPTYAAVYRDIYGHSPHKRGGKNVYSAEEAMAILDWFVARDQGSAREWSKPHQVYVRRVLKAAAEGRPYPDFYELERRCDAADRAAWRRER